MGVIKEPLGSLIIGSCPVAEEVKDSVERWVGGVIPSVVRPGPRNGRRAQGLDPTQGVRPRKVQLSAFRGKEIYLGGEEAVEVEKVRKER